MSKRVALWAAVATVLGLPARAGGAPMQPLKPWVLDVGETQCTATREFGQPDNPITLVIRPAPNDETYELILVQKQANGPTFAAQYDGSVDFGGKPLKVKSLKYHPKNQGITQHHFRLRKSDMEQAKLASSITFKSDGLVATSLILKSMPAVLDGLANCNADLMRYWNIDGANVGTIAVPSKGDLRSIFTSEDYPNEALIRSQQGKAQFLLLIDTEGKVAACHLYEASGVPALDAMGCQAIRQRAKFKPALDRNGKPVRSSYVTPPIIWRMQ